MVCHEQPSQSTSVPVALLVSMFILASCAPMHRSVTSRFMDRYSPIDLEIVERSFVVYYWPERGLFLGTINQSVYSALQRSDEAFGYNLRCAYVLVTHIALRRHDSSYDRRFKRAESELIEMLDPEMTRGEGGELLLGVFEKHGVLADLINASVPASERTDRFGSYAMPWARDAPFIVGPVGLRDFPPSVKIFSYCNGGVVTSGDSGNPYVRAHKVLRSDDPDYAAALGRLIRSAEAFAEELDGSGVLFRARVTDYIREFAVENGIRTRLESVVARHSRQVDTEAAVSELEGVPE